MCVFPEGNVDAFEATFGPTSAATAEHVAATAEIAECIRRAMVARRIPDGIVKNVYAGAVGKLAAWTSASHIERPPKATPPTLRVELPSAKARASLKVPNLVYYQRRCFNKQLRGFFEVTNMSEKQDAEELFEMVGQDAQAWLEQARQLKMSADVIWVELEKIIPLPQVKSGVRLKRLAYQHSFMLLTGLAFENLIKGILIGRDKTVVDQQRIDKRLWNFKGGHGIAELVRCVGSVTSDESDLLRRLEEYLIWAGRYPLPLKSKFYITGRNFLQLRLRTDLALINQLFQRLEEILKNEWEVQSKSEST